MQSVKTYLQENNRMMVLYVLATTLLSIGYHGYFFNTGDQGEHLPAVYQLWDNELYPHDFFMQQFHLTFSVRSYLIWVLYGLSTLTGVAGASFILFFACRFLLLMAWFNLSVLLTGRQAAAYLLIPLLIVIGNIEPGGNGLIEQLLTSNTLANMLASWGIFYFFKQRYTLAMVLIGLCSCFQVLTGLQVFTCFMLVESITMIRQSKYSILPLKHLFWYVLFASPMLIPQVYHSLLMHYPKMQQQAFYTTLIYQRAPWHYLPSAFPLKTYILYFLILGAGIAASLMNGIHSVKRLYPIFLIILVGCLLYYIGLELMGIMAIGKTQWFKSTMWLTGFSSIMISSAIVNRIRIPHLSSRYVQVSLLGINLMGFVVFIFPSQVLPNALESRYMTGFYKKSSLQEVHAYVRMNTSKDALFMISPDNESFGCEAQRSVPVNYKSVIHEVPYFSAWRKAMHDWYQIDFNEKEVVLPKAVNNFHQHINDATYSCDYLVVNTTRVQVDTALWKEVYKSGNDALYLNLRLYRDFAIRH